MGGGCGPLGGKGSKRRFLSGLSVCLVGLCSLPPALAAVGTSWEPLRAAGSVQGSSCPAPYHSPAGSRPQPLSTWAGRRELPAGSWKSALSRQVYIEDSLGERIWVDSPHCKTFVDNIQTAFNTKMPPKSVLLQGEAIYF